jgi:hypothetical protein
MNHKPRLFTGRWLVITALALALGPWLVGWAMRPAGWEFFGAWPKAPGDAAVYYSYIDQGRSGGPLMIDKFTTESQHRNIWQPIWWLAGRSSVGLTVSAPVIFMIWRLLAAAVCALAIWWASGLIFSDQKTRHLAAGLGYFGAGLGGLWSWLAPTSNLLKQPVDLWVSEAYPWLSSLASPHFGLVTAGLVLVLVGTEYAWPKKWVRWLAGPTMLLTISIHPFHVVTIFVIWLAISVAERWLNGRWDGAAIKRRLWLLLWSGPALIYYGLTLFDPVAYDRAIQNVNRTPSWWLVIIGILPLVIGALGSVKSKNRRHLMVLWAWAVTVAVLIMVPWPWARRLMQAWAVPLAFLAAAGLGEWWASGTASRRAVIIGVATLMVITPIKVVSDALVTYANDGSAGTTTLSYLSPSYRGLISFVNNRPALRVIMAGKMNGNIIGGLTSSQVYFGSNVETVNAAEKEATVAKFYGTWTTDEQWRFITTNNICAVLVTPREETYGGKVTADQWPSAKIVYHAKEIDLIETGRCQ